jgi:hypothetical protein
MNFCGHWINNSNLIDGLVVFQVADLFVEVLSGLSMNLVRGASLMIFPRLVSRSLMFVRKYLVHLVCARVLDNAH